jgi:mono/diheme cytochrome c family protein
MRKRIYLLHGALLIAAACRAPSGAREARDFERMRRQQRYDAYDVGAAFPNRQTLQAPPAQTVARGPAFAERPGATKRDALLGAQQYGISCAPCHGAAGFGGGPIAPNLVDKRPPSLRSATIAGMSAEQILAVVTNGVGRMPPLGWQMPPDARDSVASYVRSLGAIRGEDAARKDSTMAAYLARIDSLAASGGGLDAVLRLRAGRR